MTQSDNHQVIISAVHPCLAATPGELAALRLKWKEPGPDGKIIRTRIAEADQLISHELIFPPRGGQHNQFYQCDSCQMSLTSLDPTHHQCPVCRKVYTGEPYDDVIFARNHTQNLKRMSAGAWAFAVTGENKYADDARRVLLGYADRYTKYPFHSASRDNGARSKIVGGHLAEQTLNEAWMMAILIAPAMDLLDAAFSSSERAVIRDGLLIPMLRNIEKNKAGKSNWQSWHNAALFAGGILIGDKDMADRSLNDPENGFYFQMNASVTAEGMWYENSWSYHAYTLSALVAHAEAARRCGIDLWCHPAFRRMFLLPARYTMADGSLPRFGDAVGSAAGVAPEDMEAAMAAIHDERLSGLAPTKPGWESVLHGRKISAVVATRSLESVVFPEAGHALLRTTGEAGLTAAVTFGPYGGFHGHLDKLTFVLFGFGRELGVDPGRAKSQAYRLPIHDAWYKATLSHNAVVVDGHSQAPAAGQLLAFASTPNYAAVLTACDSAYPGVMHRRLVCQTPAYLLVIDDLAASTDRRFDWIYHNRAESVSCAAASKDSAAENNYPGQEYLANIKSGTTDAVVRAIFTGTEVVTHLVAAPAPGTIVRTADGPAEDIKSRVPLIMLTRHGKSAHFAVVLNPTPAGAASPLRDITLEERDNRLEVCVRGEVVDFITITADNHFTVRHGDALVLASKDSR